MADGWEINGIRGLGPCPELAGKFSGPLVILGSAPCLWEDLNQVRGEPAYMAINWAGCFAGKRIEHWASKHPEYLSPWRELYKQTYYPSATENPAFNFFSFVSRPHVYTHAPRDAEINWNFETETAGSSSMFGILVALALGYGPIWLAGIPLDKSGHFYQSPWEGPADYEPYRQSWLPMAEFFVGRVKSFSGWTRELLGAP